MLGEKKRGSKKMSNDGRTRLQSSFELLVTLSFGLAVLLPIVAFAFLQIANANSSLSATAAQLVASKIASTATLVGSEGFPAKQVIQISMPPGVQNVYVGTLTDTIGHEVIIVIRSSTGYSYITSYTPQNVTGNLGSITSSGTYLINVSAQTICPLLQPIPCVYVAPIV